MCKENAKRKREKCDYNFLACVPKDIFRATALYKCVDSPSAICVTVPAAHFNNFLTGVNFRAWKLHSDSGLLGLFRIYEFSVSSDETCDVIHSRTRSTIKSCLERHRTTRIKFLLFISFIYTNVFSTADGYLKNGMKQKTRFAIRVNNFLIVGIDYWWDELA